MSLFASELYINWNRPIISSYWVRIIHASAHITVRKVFFLKMHSLLSDIYVFQEISRAFIWNKRTSGDSIFFSIISNPKEWKNKVCCFTAVQPGCNLSRWGSSRPITVDWWAQTVMSDFCLSFFFQPQWMLKYLKQCCDIIVKLHTQRHFGGHRTILNVKSRTFQCNIFARLLESTIKL